MNSLLKYPALVAPLVALATIIGATIATAGEPVDEAIANSTLMQQMHDERADHDSFQVAQACGHYVILGCFKRRSRATRRLNDLGGPGVGGWAGARVVHTNDFPNFRNGWFCVADGPYGSRSEAMSIAWKEAVRDAYVKSGC